ncbi:hypothetical protein HY637_03745 [Candidatus Woesearchaeota archaeon]|nr:hypothetical protein [Candidatus Woesearchaeota archaeon]
MNLNKVKEFLKPTILKMVIFIIANAFIFYLSKESVCGVIFYFPFCYNAYGLPLSYAISGDIETAAGHIKTLPLGNYYSKAGSFLLNPSAFVFDMLFAYLAACLIAMLLKTLNFKALKT